MKKSRIIALCLIFALALFVVTGATVNTKGSYSIDTEESVAPANDGEVNTILEEYFENENMNNAAREFNDEVNRCGTADNLTRLNACTAAMKTVNDGFEQ